MGLGEPGPLRDMAHGATRAAIEWTEEKVKAAAAQLLNRKLAFVRDPETISLIREERGTQEAKLLRQYIADKRLRELVVLGLGLRKLERTKGGAKRLQVLRQRIHRRHHVNGLQAAELIQRGIVFLLLGRFISEQLPPDDIRRGLEGLLTRVRKHTAFVKRSDNIRSLVAVLKVKVLAVSPDLFIVLGHGEAMDKAARVVDSLLKALPKGFGAERHQLDTAFFAFIGTHEEEGLLLSLPA